MKTTSFIILFLPRLVFKGRFVEGRKCCGCDSSRFLSPKTQNFYSELFFTRFRHFSKIILQLSDGIIFSAKNFYNCFAILVS